MGLVNIEANYLACFGKTNVSMYCQLAQPLMHIGFCQLFIIHFQLNAVGCGIAMLCSNIVTYIIILVASRKFLPEAKAGFEVSWLDPRNFKQIPDYLKLAVPSMLMIILEWSASMMVILSSGRVSFVDQTVATIFQNISMATYAIPTGLNASACTIIGNSIGQNNWQEALHQLKYLVLFILVISVIEGAGLILFLNRFVSMFTLDEEVLTISNRIGWGQVIWMFGDLF